jgi:hypothetical protein
MGLMVGTMLAGLVVRFVPTGLPTLMVKYGGSMLWALLFYWLISTLLPRWRVDLVALISGGLTTGIEFFKLHHSPAVDAFRLTIPGILLLGRFFSVWDILAYWVAICIGSLVDGRLRARAT